MPGSVSSAKQYQHVSTDFDELDEEGLSSTMQGKIDNVLSSFLCMQRIGDDGRGLGPSWKCPRP